MALDTNSKELKLYKEQNRTKILSACNKAFQSFT